MIDIIYVAVGGFIGSILRFALSVKFKKHPIGTWIANISGALLLAILLRFYLADILPLSIWLFAGVGFSGAYTTFSTFSNEVLEYVVNEQIKKAAIYAGSSFITACLIVFVVLSI